MRARSHVYSSCFWRHSAESVAGSLVRSRPASMTEWTSKSVPYASKTYPRMRAVRVWRSEEHTSELQSHSDLVCRLLLEKKNMIVRTHLREAEDDNSDAFLASLASPAAGCKPFRPT